MIEKRIKKKGYKFIYTILFQAYQVYCRIRNPEVFGSYVLCQSENKVLLIKHSYKKYWTLPCGGISMGETPVEAAIRESREEVGLRLRSDQLILRAKILYEGENQKENIHLFEYCFEHIPEITIDHKEVEDFRWVSQEELKQYYILEPIYPYVYAALN